jgi:hypothetical protein
VASCWARTSASSESLSMRFATISGKQVHINPVAAAELAGAERALALHHATEEQIERLRDADRYRSAADRVHAWEESDHRRGSPSA